MVRTTDRQTSVLRAIDWWTVVIYIALLIFGWVSVCGASYTYGDTDIFSLSTRSGMQIVWIGTSLFLGLVLLLLDDRFYDTFAYVIYAALLLLLFLTIFNPHEIKGSRSWLVLGPLRLQPAEFAKFATALAVAKLMNSYNFNLFTFRNFSLVLLLILAPMACVVMQKETGTALVFLAFGLMLYREGMSGYILLASVCAVTFFVIVMKYNDMMLGITPVGELIVASLTLIITLFLVLYLCRDRLAVRIMLYVLGAALAGGLPISFYLPGPFLWVLFGGFCLTVLMLIFLSLKNLAWSYALIALFAVASIGFMLSVDYVFNDMLEPHQQQRIRVSLGLEDDPGGAGYNVNQSKIAIGSGGLLGKGFLNGTQTKLKYVPEQDTDFIFCTVGEEFGFVGSFCVLFLFGAMIIRLVSLAERQDTRFGRVYGYCVASIFFFHLVINIGMVLGLTPVIGIPLPFFSYGGSSLWGFTILLFIFLRIDATRREG